MATVSILKARASACASYAKKMGLRGFDWAAIIKFIMSLLGGCGLTKDDVIAEMANPGPFALFAMRRGCQPYANSGDERRAMVRVLEVKSKEMSHEEASALFDEATTE